MAVPVDRLQEAFTDASLRRRWLADAPVHLRTAKPGRTARLTWAEPPSVVVVGFTARAADKSQVAVAHERLPDAEAAARFKAYWRERLAALKKLLES